MTEQASLWQDQQQTNQFAELCSALYEREVLALASANMASVLAIQAKLKSLPYYIQKTAHSMLNAETPLTLDSQNATWSVKQRRVMPLAGQNDTDISHWYQHTELTIGLVVPIKKGNLIILDCIDRIDHKKHCFRTNVHGWFNYLEHSQSQVKLLKPTKKVMEAACAGHKWQAHGLCSPVTPSLRELLLSCTINWKNMKKPLLIRAF